MFLLFYNSGVTEEYYPNTPTQVKRYYIFSYRPLRRVVR